MTTAASRVEVRVRVHRAGVLPAGVHQKVEEATAGRRIAADLLIARDRPIAPGHLKVTARRDRLVPVHLGPVHLGPVHLGPVHLVQVDRLVRAPQADVLLVGDPLAAVLLDVLQVEDLRAVVLLAEAEGS